MSTLQMILDTLMSNPGLWWPVVAGGLSFGFKWLSSKSLPLYVMLSSMSPDVPQLLYGLRMCFNKSLPWPPAKPLPHVSADK